MTAADVLKAKTEPMPVIRQSDSVLAAVRQMLSIKETGLLILTPGGDVVGIITQQDVLRLVAERYTQLDKVEVWEVMSKSLKTVPHTATVDEALALMTEQHIHHLPVMKDDKPAGLISLDDIISMRLRRTEDEARALKDFIAQQ
jgi:CBS domain-containing protein